MKMKTDMKKEVAKLQKKVTRWTKDWVANENRIEMFWVNPPNVFKAYLDGEDNSELLGLRADKLHFWHFVQYMNAVLNEGKDGLEDFALAAWYAYAVVCFEDAFANAGQGGSILLDESIFSLSLSILSGWKKEANDIGDILYNGLDNKLLDLRHNEEHEAGKVYQHFWFLMHLSGDIAFWRRKIDTSLYSYPDDMEPYKSVLADWETRDLSKVQQYVSAMADFHVMETKPTRYEEISEFDGEDVMIFPHEILSFLRIREWHGLSNPETFEHPLMNQPLAKLPPAAPLPKPETPLLDKVIEKFKKEYPGSFESWK
ncbi:MAG: hypothetical protein WBI25_06950 [Smithellaceae bacterium]|jgi:hypothetical protein